MSDRNQCPVLRQGKKEIYLRLPDYCLPTLIVDMPLDEGWDGTLSVAVMGEIKRCGSNISLLKNAMLKAETCGTITNCEDTVHFLWKSLK